MLWVKHWIIHWVGITVTRRIIQGQPPSLIRISDAGFAKWSQTTRCSARATTSTVKKCFASSVYIRSRGPSVRSATHSFRQNPRDWTEFWNNYSKNNSSNVRSVNSLTHILSTRSTWLHALSTLEKGFPAWIVIVVLRPVTSSKNTFWKSAQTFKSPAIYARRLWRGNNSVNMTVHGSCLIRYNSSKEKRASQIWTFRTSSKKQTPFVRNWPWHFMSVTLF